MLITPDDLAKVLQAYKETVKLLDQLESLGFKYKRLFFFDFDPGGGYPRWRGVGEEYGIIQFPDTADPRSVAHEMGHGFYECLYRDYDLPESFLKPSSGEAFSEAIRWFVEEQLGGRKWEPQNNTVLLDLCGRDFSRFKECCKASPERSEYVNVTLRRQGGPGRRPGAGAALTRSCALRRPIHLAVVAVPATATPCMPRARLTATRPRFGILALQPGGQGAAFLERGHRVCRMGWSGWPVRYRPSARTDCLAAPCRRPVRAPAQDQGAVTVVVAIAFAPS
jgi:hypothetical protein